MAAPAAIFVWGSFAAVDAEPPHTVCVSDHRNFRRRSGEAAIQDIFEEIGHATWLPFSVIALRMALATLLGAVIGFEREWRNHPAGLRTHILVALAAACFAIIGIEIVHTSQFEDDGARHDPLRLIEAVTAGVAFLAAGTIIVARGRIKGLTTGAGLWLAGAVGLAAGLGFWQIAALATMLAVVVLGLLHPLERAVVGDPEQKPDDG